MATYTNDWHKRVTIDMAVERHDFEIVRTRITNGSSAGINTLTKDFTGTSNVQRRRCTSYNPDDVVSNENVCTGNHNYNSSCQKSEKHLEAALQSAITVALSLTRK
jgi:hypothetical protein